MTEIFIGGLLHHWVDTTPVETTSFKFNAIIKVNNYNLLVGKNSINKPIYGMGYDFKFTEYVDFKFGGYIQDPKPFIEYGYEVPPIVPIIGLDISIPLTENISLTTLVTPLLSFTGVSISFD